MFLTHISLSTANVCSSAGESYEHNSMSNKLESTTQYKQAMMALFWHSKQKKKKVTSTQNKSLQGQKGDQI